MTALKESEERFRQFAENSRDLLWIWDRGIARMEYLSPAFHDIWGRDPEPILRGQTTFLTTIHPEDREQVSDALLRILAGERASLTYRVLRPDGAERWVRDRGFAIRDEHGAIIRAAGICQDITGQRLVEHEREKSLHDRELLLREVNHRVKNNLQVVISLLRLQAGRSASEEVRAAFEEACGRVSTIAELHVDLFAGAQIGALDFGAYLHGLCRRLESTLGGVGLLRIRVDAEPALIDLDRAIPLGLIVNELVTNATRQRHLGARDATIEVKFHRLDGQYCLRVRDDHPAVIDGERTTWPEGLALQLIHGFVRRIQGRLSLRASDTLEATVSFPVDAVSQQLAWPKVTL